MAATQHRREEKRNSSQLNDGNAKKQQK